MHKSILLTLLLVACSSDGLSDSTKAKDLTDPEIKEFCGELAAEHPEKTVDCGGGLKITVGSTQAECEMETNTLIPMCEATLGDFRACADAIAALSATQLCTSQTPPTACTKVFACSND